MEPQNILPERLRWHGRTSCSSSNKNSVQNREVVSPVKKVENEAAPLLALPKQMRWHGRTRNGTTSSYLREYRAWTERFPVQAAAIVMLAVVVCFIPTLIPNVQVTSSSLWWSLGSNQTSSGTTPRDGGARTLNPSPVAHYIGVCTFFLFGHLVVLDPLGGLEGWSVALISCNLLLSILQLARAAVVFLATGSPALPEDTVAWLFPAVRPQMH